MTALRELSRHRDLLWLLVMREIRIRYARAALGAGWAVAVPVVTVLVFTGLRFSRLLDASDGFAAVPYPLFAYCGLVPWSHFATSLTQATPSLVNLRDLLRKSAFPREVIPLSKLLAALLDLTIGAVLLLVLLVAYGRPPGPSALAVPLILLLQLAFTAGLALLLAVGNVYFRDVNYLLQVGIVLLMFASPVVYPLPPERGATATLLRWNPMASYLTAYREALLLGSWPGDTLLPGALGAAASLGLGLAVFRHVSARLPEEV